MAISEDRMRAMHLLIDRKTRALGAPPWVRQDAELVATRRVFRGERPIRAIREAISIAPALTDMQREA